MDRFSNIFLRKGHRILFNELSRIYKLSGTECGCQKLGVVWVPGYAGADANGLDISSEDHSSTLKLACGSGCMTLTMLKPFTCILKRQGDFCGRSTIAQ